MEPRDDLPNVVIILSDQLRRQALSVYGDGDARTPHVEALARDGVRFTHACATSPICVPFRFTFMTGEYAHSRKVPGIEYVMSPAERTLADEFNEAGYETVYIGKWHLDGGHGRLGSAEQVNRTPVPRSQQGRWQTWQGFELRNDPFDTWIFENDDPVPKKLPGYQTDALFDRAMTCLRGRTDRRPFCLVVSVEPPHDPFVAPADLQAEWEAREITLPPNFAVADIVERERVIRDRKRYAAMVENLDGNLGRMREFLEELRPERVFFDAPWRAFRTRRYKYTVKGNNLGAEPWQFFDLETDPWEQRNLLGIPAMNRKLPGIMGCCGGGFWRRRTILCCVRPLGIRVSMNGTVCRTQAFAKPAFPTKLPRAPRGKEAALPGIRR